MSRVEIDINNRQKIKDLTHLGAYHNWVETSFPDEFEYNQRSRKLWRIDQLEGKHYLLVVSSGKPNLNKFETYGVKGSAKTQNYETFLNQIEKGMKAKFKVTLNPVFSENEESNRRGRVLPLLSEEDQMDFLLRRSEKNGFMLEPEAFVIVEKDFKRLEKPGKKTLRVNSATYQGELTVSNVEVFKKTLTEGFGKKKAYGFGLMTIIPEKYYE